MTRSASVQELLGPGTPDPSELLDRLVETRSQGAIEEVAHRLSEELLLRAQSGPFAVNALCAVKGKPEEVASVGHALMLEAEKVDRPELAAEGQCWLILAALRGDHASAVYLDEIAMTKAGSPAPSAEPAGPMAPLRIPRAQRFARTAVGSAPEFVATEVVMDDLPESAAVDLKGPGRMVVRELGDPRSKDGLELHKRFKDVIGRKLPYGGAFPEPGAFAAYVRSRWPWAEDAGRLIEGRLALMRHSFSEFVRLPPMMFVGPTGSAKTTLALELGRAIGLHTMQVPCGGVADAGGLAATTRGWNTNRPSAPFMAIAQSGQANPVVLLDELDKGTSARAQNGSVWAAALAMTEKSDRYNDSCLMADVDLSAVTFLATANYLDVMPIELKDRFTIVKVPRPRPQDFPVVLTGALEEVAKAMQTDVDLLPRLDRDDRAFLRDMFSQQRNSLRTFRKVVEMLLSEKASAAEREAGPRVLH